MTVVLDSSALLAALLNEPGKARVDAAVSDAVMSTVNLAEVIGYFAKAGASREQIAAMLDGVPLVYLSPDPELAMDAGMLRPAGETAGLSLGDRMCLSLAKRLQTKALTADRAWKPLAAQLGIEVELIR